MGQAGNWQGGAPRGRRDERPAVPPGWGQGRAGQRQYAPAQPSWSPAPQPAAPAQPKPAAAPQATGKQGVTPRARGCALLVVLVPAALITWFVVATGNSTTPAPPSLTPYEQAMNTMTSNCTQSSAELEDDISRTYAAEVKAGVKGATVSGTALGMSSLTAGNVSPQDCSQEFALYLQQQEGK